MEQGRRTHYFRTDLYRAFTGKEIWIGTVGVAFAMFFALGSLEELESSVIDTVIFSAYNVGFMLTFVFCAFPFGGAYCEELENHYARHLLIRGSLKKYVIAKSAVIFLSSIVTMTLGVVLFAVICRARLPWIDMETYDSSVAYEGLLQNGNYLLWTVVYGAQWGIWAGCLSVVSAFCSLYISNRLLLLAMPVLLDQMLTELGTGNFRRIAWLDPHTVFDASHQLLGSNVKTLLWALGAGLVVTAIFGALSFFKLRKRM